VSTLLHYIAFCRTILHNRLSPKEAVKGHHMIHRFFALISLALLALMAPATAQEPLRIEIDNPNIEPDSPVQFSDWKAINAQALVTGSVSTAGDDQIVVKFRLFDVFSESQLGEGLQFVGSRAGWRRMAHKVADAVYSRITGEGAYFDSRLVYVSESGPKNARSKRIAIMDYDGANNQFLTTDQSIVLAPRFSPDGNRVIYTSYETGFPKIYVLDIGTVSRQILSDQPGTMSFAPRFAPDGQSVIYSLTTGSNTDLYKLSINGGAPQQLTSDPTIETAPSFAPDGSQIVFESDRSGTPQLYVMPSGGGAALIAFTKQNRGRFHIGVMNADGSGERLLTASFLDEGPTWAPNGRVINRANKSHKDHHYENPSNSRPACRSHGPVRLFGRAFQPKPLGYSRRRRRWRRRGWRHHHRRAGPQFGRVLQSDHRRPGAFRRRHLDPDARGPRDAGPTGRLAEHEPVLYRDHRRPCR